MSSADPQIVEFGPYRVIGMSCVSKNENGEFSRLWDAPDGFLARKAEVQTASAGHALFGLCRCVPGVTDGSFQYIAAAPATRKAAVPEGVVEASIAGCTYAGFQVSSLAEISQAWAQTGAWMEAHPEWEPYCGPDGCDCENHPSFELYPPDFCEKGELFVFVPLRKK